ncbi:hypothetical protein Srot_2886 [Segniliparus rotundus DSM 44985]|uniref:PknH-like extracellular domain-containing protein n=1 Tax=Segniliparus rotundus (strain ATCC BAA-972 / CDC 1076 / CIP 108378 / DSM 44985 / JCM 13578) TaxID=640132 RepID=D6ZDR0_SEGRD|nr:sensor domain-containing protein [Segniliparus rotundus]ADG99317.1 hypothetical protein Srot_2886 [Segniliparus rotundus DSM 44985]
MRRVALTVLALLFAGCAHEEAGQRAPVQPEGVPSALSTMTATLPTSSAPAAISADQIVLSLDELNALTGFAKYRGGADLKDTRSPLPAEGEVDPKQCQPALRGLQSELVAGDGFASFRAVESVTVGDPALPQEQRRKDDFVQVAAVYPGEGAASEVFAALADGVGSCGNRTAVDIAPGGAGKTAYDVTVAERSAGTVRWSQHQAEWGEAQKCVLEARLVKNVVLQDIECGVSSPEAAVGELLSSALSKASGRIP